MPKPSTIITTAAALMNDSAQTRYTNAVVLPYLNLALNILQEVFELNDIPKTHKTSATILVPANTRRVGFDTTPTLPVDLIEIQQLWESQEGQNRWIPVTKRDFLPHSLEINSSQISQFLVWAWMSDSINILPALSPNDLKLDYTGSVFKTPIVIANIDVEIHAINIQTFLEFETASLCAMFIAENETRASALAGEAGTALQRSLGISIKGTQSILFRRRPFRASFKRRGVSY